MLNPSSLVAMASRVAASLTPNQVKVALGVLAAAAALACGLGFAEFTESVWRGERAVTLDELVMQWVLGHRSGPVTETMQLVTNLAGPQVVVAIVVGVAALARWQGRPKLGVFIVASTVGASLLVAVVKLVVGRPRPGSSERLVSVTGASFPSGHAAQSVACWVALAVVVAWVLARAWVTVAALLSAFLMAGVVGGSRVYLGVHWPSDVIAGWSLGLAWMASLLAAFAFWDVLTRRGPDSSPRAGVPTGQEQADVDARNPGEQGGGA